MKIGIYCGSFNPPHLGHKGLVEYIFAQKDVGLDKIIIVPAGNTYPKKGLIQIEHRIKMLEYTFEEVSNVIISDIEKVSSKRMYTIDVLEYYQNIYPNDEIVLIIGGDTLEFLHEWKRADVLLKKFSIIVLDRRIDFKNIIDRYYKLKECNICFLNEYFNILSSTEIRNCILEDLSVKDKLNSNVIKYIKNHYLYRFK